MLPVSVTSSAPANPPGGYRNRRARRTGDRAIVDGPAAAGRGERGVLLV